MTPPSIGTSRCSGVGDAVLLAVQVTAARANGACTETRVAAAVGLQHAAASAWDGGAQGAIGSTLLAFNWESHGNHTISTSRALKGARDRIWRSRSAGRRRDAAAHGASPQVRLSSGWSKLWPRNNGLRYPKRWIALSVKRVKNRAAAIHAHLTLRWNI